MEGFLLLFLQQLAGDGYHGDVGLHGDYTTWRVFSRGGSNFIAGGVESLLREVVSAAPPPLERPPTPTHPLGEQREQLLTRSWNIKSCFFLSLSAASAHRRKPRCDSWFQSCSCRRWGTKRPQPLINKSGADLLCDYFILFFCLSALE